MTPSETSQGGGLLPVDSPADVLEAYRGTPIEKLLLAQNLGEPYARPERPELVVATCVDPRIVLPLPEGSAFISRSAGVNLKGEKLFQIAFATAVPDIRHVAVIAHTDCAMRGLADKRRAFLDGLAAHGADDRAAAESFFDRYVEHWTVGDELEVVRADALAVRERCGDVLVAPLLYDSATRRIAQVL